MAYGTEQRMWTLEEYIEKYEQLQAENKKMYKENEKVCAALRELQAENERYKTALQAIVVHEEARKKINIGYDLYVHDTAVEALVF